MTPDKRDGPAGNGTESTTHQPAGQASPRVTRTPDTIRQARVTARVTGNPTGHRGRPWWRPGWGSCGCEHPRRHQDGCLWQLDPDHRVQLAAATIVDGFPAPRLSPEREFEVILEVRADKSYARRVYEWISAGRAG